MASCQNPLKAANAAKPTAVLHVRALATARFDRSEYTVPAGLLEIRYTGATGLTFTFDDPRYRYCLLDTDRGGVHTCRVLLDAGDYVVYDSVPGHQAAGLQATIHVEPPPLPPEG
jgi:hypothetical protein